MNCSLEEVIVPPSTETIGVQSFSGNKKLASIIMGHSVKSIGEKAFDGCTASTVSITAPTPPNAPNNTFSNYSGKLYLQDDAAKEAYYDAFTCWDRFDSYVMIKPTGIEFEGEKSISGKPGDTFQLKATLMPANVTLPQVFWRSTHPEIATVDINGLVTLHVDTSEVIMYSQGSDKCMIIVESLYADGPVAEVEVKVEGVVGVEEISTDDRTRNEIDYTMPYEVYDLRGVKINATRENLTKGIYIVRQGNTVNKIAVK